VQGVLHTRLCTLSGQKLQFRVTKEAWISEERSTCTLFFAWCWYWQNGNLLPLWGRSRSVARVAARKLRRPAAQICSASADGRKGPTPGRRLPFYRSNATIHLIGRKPSPRRSMPLLFGNATFYLQYVQALRNTLRRQIVPRTMTKQTTFLLPDCSLTTFIYIKCTSTIAPIHPPQKNLPFRRAAPFPLKYVLVEPVGQNPGGRRFLCM